jgi:hypothetical protein
MNFAEAYAIVKLIFIFIRDVVCLQVGGLWVQLNRLFVGGPLALVNSLRLGALFHFGFTLL